MRPADAGPARHRQLHPGRGLSGAKARAYAFAAERLYDDIAALVVNVAMSARKQYGALSPYRVCARTTRAARLPVTRASLFG